MKRQPIYEVWQGSTLVCSASMKLSKQAALNKVENERRMGNVMEARLAPKAKKRRSKC